MKFMYIAYFNSNSELLQSTDKPRSSENNLASLYSSEEPLRETQLELYCGLVSVPTILTCDINISLLYVT